MGSFYASYSAGSLILGAAAVERFGADRVIKGSMIAMLCYLVVFTATASSQLPADGIVMWSLSLAGSIVGGAALGLGFSAQGVTLPSAIGRYPLFSSFFASLRGLGIGR